MKNISNLRSLAYIQITICAAFTLASCGGEYNDADPLALTWVSPSANGDSYAGNATELTVETQNPEAKTVHFAIDGEEVAVCDSAVPGEDCYQNGLWTQSVSLSEGKHTLTAWFAGNNDNDRIEATQEITFLAQDDGKNETEVKDSTTNNSSAQSTNPGDQNTSSTSSAMMIKKKYDGEDPNKSWCVNSAIVARTAAIRRLDNNARVGTVELRYSKACRTVWGRIKTDGAYLPIYAHSAGAEVYVVRNSDGAKMKGGAGIPSRCNNSRTICWTNMLNDKNVTSYAYSEVDMSIWWAHGKTDSY